jgi:hypothetical protein
MLKRMQLNQKKKKNVLFETKNEKQKKNNMTEYTQLFNRYCAKFIY